MKRLGTAWKIFKMKKGEKKEARGAGKQKDRREMERVIKKGALAFCRWARRHGMTRESAAEQIGLSDTTLGYWDRGWKDEQLDIHYRGRPAEESSRIVRNEIYDLLKEMGPCIGVPALQKQFRSVPRRELENMLCRYRNLYQKKNNVIVHALSWKFAGAVWAMDFTEPPTPVDGIYRYIFAVRDMASGKQLLTLPVPDKGAKTARDALTSLFKQYKAPLVVKCDNEGSFKSKEVQEIFLQNGVIFLLSPPYYPCYNGACEAGIGSLKTRAHHIAARNDRPGEWTSDDVEGARLMANETARPKGRAGPAPDEAWNMRLEVGRGQRRRFLESVREYRVILIKENGFQPETKLSKRKEEAIERKAVARALVKHGYLSIRRRRIPQPIKSCLRGKIS